MHAFVLRIGHIRKLGLLAPEGTPPREIDIGIKIWVEPLDNECLTICVPTDQRFGAELSDDRRDPSSWYRHGIAYVYRDRKYGKRAYFVCPTTRRDCLILVMCRHHITGDVALRAWAGVRGMSYREIRYAKARATLLSLDGRKSRSAKDLAMKQLLRLGGPAPDDSEFQAYFERESLRVAGTLNRADKKASPLGTQRALNLGRDATNQDGDYNLIVREPMFPSPRAPTSTKAAAARRAARPPLDELMNYPALDIRTLIRCNYFVKNTIYGRTLVWPDRDTQGRTIMLISDWRYLPIPYLIASVFNPTEGFFDFQPISLTRGPRGDHPRYMQCPVLGKQCDILYFRNGRFASREAQGLYHSSQLRRRYLGKSN